MQTNRRSCAALFFSAVLLVTALAPDPAAALSLTLRNEVDPVPPGGTLIYTIRVSGESIDGSPTGCFNPPPECITSAATCLKPTPVCSGNSFTGYVCENAANEGVDCGVGDPPAPDYSVCLPIEVGTCDGGLNAELPCSSQSQCPGLTFVCVRSFNDGAFCGVGLPPQPESGLCIQNPEGICASGPNFGEPCTSNADCPDDSGATNDEDITITLPMPLGTSFLSADNGGTTDGANLTWTIPPLAPCGVPGTPQCPLLTGQLLVSAGTPVGTVLEAQASAIDGTTTVLSNILKTTIGTFKLRRFKLSYRPRESKDRLVYRGFFTLPPGATLDPVNEAFRLLVETGSATTVAELALAPGALLPASATSFVAVPDRDAGIRRMRLREIAPSHYLLRLRATKLDLLEPENFQVTVSLTFGDDVLTQPMTLVVRRGGRAFIALQ